MVYILLVAILGVRHQLGFRLNELFLVLLSCISSVNTSIPTRFASDISWWAVRNTCSVAWSLVLGSHTFRDHISIFVSTLNALKHFLVHFRYRFCSQEILAIEATVSNLVHDDASSHYYHSLHQPWFPRPITFSELYAVAIHRTFSSLSLSADYSASQKTLCILMVHQLLDLARGDSERRSLQSNQLVTLDRSSCFSQNTLHFDGTSTIRPCSRNSLLLPHLILQISFFTFLFVIPLSTNFDWPLFV